MMEWLWEDPNVRELIREWEDKGFAEAFARSFAEAFAKSFAETYAKGFAESFSEGFDRGRAAEARWVLHKMLVARSLAVTEDLRARIDREPDVARLESWLEAAATATTIGDVFRDG